MACAICETRRPRRYCPGVRGDICAPCCGAEREVTVECPFECEYLVEARKRERPRPVGEGELPNRDIPVTERLLKDHRGLLAFLSMGILKAAMETPGVVDFDAREALDGLVRTYRTLASGVYYESRPGNPLAGAVYASVQAMAAEYRRQEHQKLGMTRTRDSDVLGLLVFLQHFEIERNNGRKRGRAFLDALRGFYADASSSAESGSSLVLP